MVAFSTTFKIQLDCPFPKLTHLQVVHGVVRTCPTSAHSPTREDLRINMMSQQNKNLITSSLVKVEVEELGHLYI